MLILFLFLVYELIDDVIEDFVVYYLFESSKAHVCFMSYEASN